LKNSILEKRRRFGEFLNYLHKNAAVTAEKRWQDLNWDSNCTLLSMQDTGSTFLSDFLPLAFSATAAADCNDPAVNTRVSKKEPCKKQRLHLCCDLLLQRQIPAPWHWRLQF
jgi:hypothetical protein